VAILRVAHGPSMYLPAPAGPVPIDVDARLLRLGITRFIAGIATAVGCAACAAASRAAARSATYRV
jgi:hypothetical protein